LINETHSERADLFDPNIYATIIFDIIGYVKPKALIKAGLTNRYLICKVTLNNDIIAESDNARRPVIYRHSESFVTVKRTGTFA